MRASSKPTPGHEKIVEFIPYKTMAMDLESIPASLTRMYVSRNDTDMVERLSLSQPELLPVGSFDDEAERYEYELKLAVPVKLHHHLRDNVEKIQPSCVRGRSRVSRIQLETIQRSRGECRARQGLRIQEIPSPP
jgi:hypothetical protein